MIDGPKSAHDKIEAIIAKNEWGNAIIKTSKLKQWQFDEFNPYAWCHPHPHRIQQKKHTKLITAYHHYTFNVSALKWKYRFNLLTFKIMQNIWRAFIVWKNLNENTLGQMILQYIVPTQMDWPNGSVLVLFVNTLCASTKKFRSVLVQISGIAHHLLHTDIVLDCYSTFSNQIKVLRRKQKFFVF